MHAVTLKILVFPAVIGVKNTFLKESCYNDTLEILLIQFTNFEQLLRSNGKDIIRYISLYLALTCTI